MASTYPNTLDSFATNRTDGTASATTHALDHDNENDAINKIEAELGVNPRGAYATVAARLTALAAANVGIPISTVTAKGDLVVGTASGAVSRLAVGTLGQILVAGSLGTPAWTGTVDAVARLNVQLGGTLSGTRRAINLIPGSGVAMSVNDDAANERVNVTITATTAAPAGPTISSFSPSNGAVSTSVVIFGTNFTGTTSVKFNNTSSLFVVDSSTQLTTSVPAGATTGPISVTTAAGTAVSAASFSLANSYSAVVQQDNPLGYWRFGEASGTVAADSGSGTVSGANNGTYTGGYTLAVVGALPNDANTGVDINGTTGRVAITTGGIWLNPSGTGDWTLEGWVRPDAVAAAQHTLFGVASTSPAFGLELSNGYLNCFINNTANASATSGTIFPTGVYTHFAVAYVAATRTVTYYFNGVADGTATFTAGNVATLASTYTNAIGATLQSAGPDVYFRFFDGRIDDFAYYQSALTSTRIAAHYAAANIAPPIVGSLLVRADFETGNLSQWWQIQCLNYGYASDAEFTRGNAIVQTAEKGSGTYAVRIDLPAATNKSACELAQGNTANTGLRRISIGTHEYMGFETKFPTGWVEQGGWGATICQFGQWPQIWASTFQFVAHATKITLAVQAGVCAFGTGCPPPNGTNDQTQDPVPSGQLTLNVWHQFILHVLYGTDTSTGAIDVWWRRRTETTWNNTVAYVGPTLQWSATPPNPALDVYDKIGFYRGPTTFAQSIYHDNWCRGTTFAAISDALT